jgi:hypothetical protein
MAYVWVKHQESQAPPPSTNKVLFDQNVDREEAVPLTTRLGDEEAELESGQK